jgi:microcin C transport system substrate-binding protein
MTYFFAVLCLLMSANTVFSKTYKNLCFVGKAKYEENFKHFDYVNPDAPKAGILRLSDLNVFDTLNLFTLKGLSEPNIRIIHGTLFEQSEDEPCSFYPFIAESVSVDEDNKTITFQINNLAKFSDGSKIRAEDVVFTFNILSQKGHPRYKTYLENFEKADVIDEQTVSFKVKSSNMQDALLSICSFPVLSKAFYCEKNFEETTLEIPVSSGAYHVEKVIPGQSIVYKRTAHWWAENLPSQKGRNNFEEIRVEIFRDDIARFEAFKKGLVDARFEYSLQNWATGYTFDDVKNGNVKKIVVPTKDPKPTAGIVINLRNSVLKDIRVRKALNYLFDFYWTNEHAFYKLMTRNDSYFPFSERASHGKRTPEVLKILEPYRKELPDEYFDSDVDVVLYKNQLEKREALEKATTLLKESGFDIINGKMVDLKSNKPLTLTFLIESPRIEKIAIGFANNAKQLGIDIVIQRLDKVQYIEKINNFEFDLCLDSGFTLHGHPLIPSKELDVYFGSKTADIKGTSNYSGIKNKVIDDLISQIIEETDHVKKMDLARALDFILLKGYYRIQGWGFDGLFLGFWKTIKMKTPLPDYPKLPYPILNWWKEESQ